MEARTVKKIFAFLTCTPFHPQWLLARNGKAFFKSILSQLEGTVLDVGCGHRNARTFLDHKASYIGLDNYHTAVVWYGSTPDIYAQAEALPLAGASIHHVLLLDVLEHIPDPGNCLREIHRVLLPRGKLIIQLPFLYPLHDTPLDFNRWTVYGITRLLEQCGFIVTETHHDGSPLETAGMLLNLALCKVVINAFNRRHPGCLLALFLPVLIPLINLVSLCMCCLMPGDDFMPFRYRILAEKKG